MISKLKPVKLSLRQRAVGKISRLCKEGVRIIDFALSEGLLASIHTKAEINALRLSDWKELKLQFEQHFNLNSNTNSESYLNILGKIHILKDLTQRSSLSELTFFEELEFCVKDCSTRELRSLYEYLRYFGDYRLSYFFRKKLLEKSIENGLTSGFYSSKDGINAAIELNQIDKAFKILSKNKLSLVGNKYLSEAKAWSHLFNGDKIKAYDIWTSNFDKSDFLFLKIIKDARVAIVGPSSTDEKSGKEIDKYDFIIRTNYRLGSNEPFSKYGKLTDISYYNQNRVNHRWQETEKNLKLLKWVMTKSQKDQNKIMNSNSFSGTARTLFLLDYIYFQSSAPQGIPVVLGDILRFQPASVKLFNSTFYCSQKSYSDNYKTTSTSQNLVSDDLRIHEPFSQFSFVKNLFDKKIIELDNTTEKVISMDVFDYAKSLQGLYGSFELT